jgi:hypothetical protein
MLPDDLSFGCANSVVAKMVVVVALLLWLLYFSLPFVEHGSSWLFQIGGNVGWIAVVWQTFFIFSLSLVH